MLHMTLISTSRVEPRPSPDPRTVLVEKYRRWYERYANETKNGRRPRHAQSAIHLRGEEREDRACDGSNEGVYRNGTVGVEAVAVLVRRR